MRHAHYPLAAALLAIPWSSEANPPSPRSRADGPNCPTLAGKDLTIEASDDEWTDTGISVSAGDLLVVGAEGRVTYSSFGNTATPWGRVTAEPGTIDKELAAISVGSLVGRIGKGKPFKIGASLASQVSESGSLRLRVHDEKYADNSGSFAVSVLVVPATMLPRDPAAPAGSVVQ